MRMITLMPIIWVAALLATLPAGAQTATPPTECGAAGVGRFVGYAEPFAKTAEDAKAQRVRVAADGYWTQCTLPEDMPPPPPPKACGVDGTPPVVTWRVGAHQCTGGLQVGIAHGQEHLYRQVLGPMRGDTLHQCNNGTPVAVRSACAPATECDTAWSLTRGAATYRYDARPADKRVALGQYVRALAADGSGLRLQCVAGSLVLAEQCEGPQQVARVYSGRQVRTFSYSGPPVNQGAKVRANQIGGDRWTMATCTAGGILQ